MLDLLGRDLPTPLYASLGTQVLEADREPGYREREARVLAKVR